jgi:competence protein ComEC
VAGLALLLAHYRVDRVYEPGMRGPGPGYAAWSGELAARGTLTGRLATGDRLALDDTRLTVLWPDRGSVPVDPPDTGTGINNVSIVLLGEVSGRRFLLAGDIEEEIDPILVSRRLPHVDVLKVAHHGSRTSSTTAFLDAVRPSVAVVSAGLGNPYGHPAPATIGRLKAHGAEVFRTDQDGSVEIAVDADRVTARSSSPRVRAALSNTVTSATTPAAALRFVCGIVRGGDPQPATASTLRASFVPRGAVAFVGPRPERGLLYDQVDVGPRARGSGGPPPLGRAAAKARQALSSCRRDRGVARSPYRWPRQPRRSPARRVGRAPPRRRQGLAAR